MVSSKYSKFCQVRRSKVDKIVADLKKDPTNLYLLQEEFFIDEVLFENFSFGIVESVSEGL